MSMQMKDPERGSPLLKEPRKVTQSQRGTFERSQLQLSVEHILGGLGLARELATGSAMGFTHIQPTTAAQGKHWSKIILKEVQALGAALLGAALSTQLLPQEAEPKARGDPAGWFPYPRTV